MKVLLILVLTLLLWIVAGFTAISIGTRAGLVRDDLSNSEVVTLSLGGLVTVIVVISIATEEFVNGYDWKITNFVDGKKNEKKRGM